MAETGFVELLAGLEPGTQGRIETHIPKDWMQGRTTYGGLTAALSLEAALQIVRDVPVRAVQVAFIGPVGGDLVISPSLLRHGKNSVFVNVDVVGEQGLSARSLFTFGVNRDSALSYSDMPMPTGLPDPIKTGPLFPDTARRPNFMQHFDMRLAEGARPVSGVDEPIAGMWLRHMDEGVHSSPTAVLALADAPPPAAMGMFKMPGPISSMTWMAEFLTDRFETDEGWFYARHAAQSISDGYSSQAMRLWATDGTPVMVGRQTVAVFV
ncbi:MAG: thioesterase family protein [Pseudomonadota bacterium]